MHTSGDTARPTLQAAASRAHRLRETWRDGLPGVLGDKLSNLLACCSTTPRGLIRKIQIRKGHCRIILELECIKYQPPSGPATNRSYGFYGLFVTCVRVSKYKL